MKYIVLALCAALACADTIENAARARMVDEINSRTTLWKAGYSPRFAEGPMADLLGVPANNAAELKAAVERGEIAMTYEDENLAVPDEFDSATNWPKCASIINDIRDQSNCGCCWAFGPSSAASDRYCIATDAADLSVTLSAEDVCFCSSSNGCGGGFPHSAWTYIAHSGAVTGGQYNNTEGPTKNLCSSFSLPHCHHHGPQGKDPYPAEGTAGCPSQRSPRCPSKCDTTAIAPHNDFSHDKYSYSGLTTTYGNAKAIQQAIMSGGPVAAAFTVYGDFENYVSGIYHHVSGGVLGGHAIRIVGWGTEGGVDYWKVANSWNPYWGENGYFRIKRGNDECGIEGQAVSSGANAKWSGPSF